MRRFFLLICLLECAFLSASAQLDTINTANLKLNVAAFREAKRTYAVFFEDSTGKRLSSADLWDRTIHLSSSPTGQKIYQFDWQWYQKDSLLAHVTATGLLPSLAPLTHEATYTKRGQRNFVFTGTTVTIPTASRRTAKDSAFSVVMNPPAFEFPMDLEILPLLPFKKVGQEFAIAFYEPGSPAANYYRLTVTGKEDVVVGGNASINCWLLKINYGQPDVFATFWISDKNREVVKMREYFRGRYRYKVKLY
ncbi:hypothetical protein EXU85_07130 [Spirosoma sp. KCTC 42546]|uniref:hypothetical protein n=1 Tax=Spirosoma sp. KCTC 42546 TaxID=2520506 RepID=UPI00115C3E1A|nr:hypothetical protein [Spirosoma sp. KCTC 42546]QDK78388.1 hypothetical protein EXU85_07130 [Spirosoma sp. KCTC 42546]